MYRQLVLVTVLSLAAAIAPERARAQTIPAERTFVPAWRDAGCAACVPNRPGRSVREFGAVGDGAVDDTAAVRAAIAWVDASPGFGMVYFPAGTYRITGTLALPAELTLRGERDAAGNRAELTFDLGGASAHCIDVSGAPAAGWQPVEPAPVHSRTMTVADAAAFAVGDHVEVRQDNDPAWDTTADWGDHAVGQVLRVTGVDRATNRLTFAHELRADYRAANRPQVRRLSMKTGVGIEDLAIERADTVAPGGGSTIRFAYAAYGRVHGVESSMCAQRHVVIQTSTDISVTGCYFDDAFDHGGGGRGYGVELNYHTGECLVEDNIFRRLRHSMLVQVGPSGNVFGYNYSREARRTEFPSSFAADIVCHGHMPHGNLFEGNIVSFVWFDAAHGRAAGDFNTLFRNASTVRGIWMRSSLGAPSCDNQNIVGNDSLTGANSVAGTGHLEWGNRVARAGTAVTVPTGTDDLPERSYYLSLDPPRVPAPAWWTIDAAPPTIGPGASLPWRAPSNPARARWDGTGPKTVGTGAPLLGMGAGSVLYLPEALTRAEPPRSPDARGSGAERSSGTPGQA